MTGVKFLKPDVRFGPNCGPKLPKLKSEYKL